MEIVKMLNEKGVIISNDPSVVREKIEEMFEERYDFMPMLQESTDDEEYQVYLHTDSYEDLTEEDLEKLEKLGITEDPEGCTEVIKKLFGLSFILEVQ